MRPLLILFISLIIFSSCQEEINSDQLKAELEHRYDLDQKDRIISDSLRKVGLYGSEQYKQVQTRIKKIDSINLVYLDSVVSSYGWLGTSLVGEKANRSLFFIVQHSNQETQEKYLPLLKESVFKGESKPKHLTLLEDRLSLSKGMCQVYGSQLSITPSGKPVFQHIKNVEKIDSTRTSIGLDSIYKYAENFNIHWTIEGYYSDLIELETYYDSINYSYPTSCD